MKRLTICRVIIGLALLSAVSQRDFGPLVQLIAFPAAISLFLIAPVSVVGFLAAPLMIPLGVWLYLRVRRGGSIPGWLLRLVPHRVRRVLRARRDRSRDTLAPVLRVVVDEDPAVTPERTVRAGYLDRDEIARTLGLDSSQARGILAGLQRGIPYSTTPGEHERVYLIPGAAVGLLDGADRDRGEREDAKGEEPVAP